MDIIHGNDVWGTMQITEHANAVSFSGTGSTEKIGYGEILRVWGMRDGKAPLLIGVAEPNGTKLCIERTMSKQYLKNLGYYPALPEHYLADSKPPQTKSQQQTQLNKLLQQGNITAQEQENTVKLSCPFDAQTEFPLAFAFCLCHVENKTAYLLWDKKTDRPAVQDSL